MATEVQASPMAVVVDGANENFVNKVSSLPVVASTMNQVSSVYNWTKESSSMVKYTLEVAEKSVAVATSTAKPVVDRFGKPISMANDIACKQLDSLQEKIPIIGEPTEKVVSTLQDGTWHVIENTKKMGSDQVNNLLNTRMGKVVTSSVDMALTASDYAIEYYLPPDEEEKLELEDEEDEVELPPEKEGQVSPTDVSMKKMGKVSTKLRRRLYQRALKNIQYAQKRSHETVEKLQFTVNLIDYAKSNIDGANQAIRTRVESTQNTLWTTWDDWTTEEGEEGQGEDAGDENVEAKNGEQKTLAIALNNLAGRLRVLSRNVAASVSVLPENLRTRVEEARDLAENVYKSFEEAQYFSDLPSNLLTRAREQLDNLQDTSKAVADYLINSRPLQWLVVDMDVDRIEFDYMAGSDQNDVDLSTDSSDM
ncbi:perilipin-2-like isoform X2 [Amphiura filiformis]|uniref:perilipin-2-like isoform X2 n=1 Tax=Amphiura filiformis TaxID=82378 RepID=UPI003B21842A